MLVAAYPKDPIDCPLPGVPELYYETVTAACQYPANRRLGRAVPAVRGAT